MINTSQKTDLIIQTTRGAVRGTQEDGIVVFRGLPFAKPPVGKLSLHRHSGIVVVTYCVDGEIRHADEN